MLIEIIPKKGAMTKKNADRILGIIKRNFSKHQVFFPSGICCVCGCTELEGCEGGCYWISKSCTICSKCMPQPEPGKAKNRLIGSKPEQKGSLSGPGTKTP
jgi:hypothetical protein